MDFTIVVAIVAFPLACAAAGYKLGEKKNQPIAGLFLGLFLGPLGVIAVALSDAKK